MRTLLSCCSTQPIATPASEFRIMPAGRFSATDGRPHGIPGWLLSRPEALSIVQLAASRTGDYVIDYEHQTLNASRNGQPNPAAGWFKRLEWREGDGLYVIDARWTERASAMIRGKEYRFISPTFHHDNEGNVLGLVNVALTNNPALDGLTDLATMALSALRPAVEPRDSDRSIEAFNRTFAGAGVFHPDTPRETIAELSSQGAPSARSNLPRDMRALDKATLHYFFPGVFNAD